MYASCCSRISADVASTSTPSRASRSTATRADVGIRGFLDGAGVGHVATLADAGRRRRTPIRGDGENRARLIRRSGDRRTTDVTATQATAPVPAGPAPRRLGPLAALAGLLSAAVALGVAELLAGLVGPVVLAGHRGGRRRHHPHARAGQGIRDPHVRRERQDRAGRRHAGAHRALRAARSGWWPAHRLLLGRTGIALFGLVGVVAAVTRPAGGAARRAAVPGRRRSPASSPSARSSHRLPAAVPPPAPSPAAAGPASDGEVLDRLR